MRLRMMDRTTGFFVFSGVALILGVEARLSADDGGILGRLFRSNEPAASPYTATRPSSTRGPAAAGTTTPVPAGGISQFGDLPQTAPVAATGPENRISPRPRSSQPVTTADPILSRIAIGRSSDGSQFGMSLQIHADGTVIDSEGVHRLRPGDLRTIGEVIQSGELYRLRGHCGAPATDFLEYVQIIVYERRMGRLTAHAFSYSGNPQGCDPSLRKLHEAIEALQVKLSRPTTGPGTPAPANAASQPIPTGAPIPLSAP